jgi:hypothetical protein
MLTPCGTVGVELLKAMEVALMNQRQESEGQESDQAGEGAEASL